MTPAEWRGGRPYGARPSEGEADEGCPRSEVPLSRDGPQRAGPGAARQRAEDVRHRRTTALRTTTTSGRTTPSPAVATEQSPSPVPTGGTVKASRPAIWSRDGTPCGGASSPGASAAARCRAAGRPRSSGARPSGRRRPPAARPSASASSNTSGGGVEDLLGALLGALEGEALELVGDLDQAAGVDHVVGRVEHARGPASCFSMPSWASWLLAAPQTIVARQRLDDLVGERAAEGARGVDVELGGDQRVGVGDGA